MSSSSTQTISSKEEQQQQLHGDTIIMETGEEEEYMLPRTFSDPRGNKADLNRRKSEEPQDDLSIQLWDPMEARLRTASESIVKKPKTKSSLLKLSTSKKPNPGYSSK